jgi:tRNA (guanine-N7-)-methyltransferase
MRLNRFAAGAFLAVIELFPESYIVRLDLQRIFGRAAPVHVDLGCGEGSFLCALAERHPGEHFLGVERMGGRVAKACRRARALENVRVLHLETSYAVRYLFPKSSVAVFYLLYPDPWPKRRHRRRRIVTGDFLAALQSALEEDGLLQIATDHLEYFRHIERLARFEQLDGFKSSSCSKLQIIPSGDLDLPVSKFEQRFRQAGASIYRLTLRKTSPVT